MVEGMERLAQLQHHVIGGVHHGVDGPQAGVDQALLQPEGRGADDDALDQGGRVASAEIGVGDFQPDEIGLRAPAGHLLPAGGQHGIAQGFSGEGGGFAGHPVDAHQMREAPLDVELQHGVPQVVRQGRAGGGVAGENQDALVFVAQSQFALRADHPLGDHAADLARLEFQLAPVPRMAVDQFRARHGQGHLERRLGQGGLAILEQVGRPGDHGQGGLPAKFHRGQAEPVRVGVGLDPAYLPHPHQLRMPLGAEGFHGLHLQPGQGQPLGQVMGSEVHIDIIGQPLQGNA